MKLVSTALDGHIDHRAVCVAEFGAPIAGLHLHLLQRVDVRTVADQVVNRIVEFLAVKDEVVGLFAIAVNIRPAAGGVAANGVEAAGIRIDGTGYEQGQSREVASFDWD